MSNDLRRHALECARLAADCRQLAEDAPSPALRTHYLQMAESWTALAAQGPGAVTLHPDRNEKS